MQFLKNKSLEVSQAHLSHIRSSEKSKSHRRELLFTELAAFDY